MSNQLVSNPDIQFNPGILEDPINHLMRSNNQLIVDVQSQLNQPLIGVFPYASFIDFDSASGLRSLATTQPEAIVQINNDRIEGPFSIIAQSSDHTRTYINNYLFITNHWLTQGDNKLILTDILQSHLDDFPLLFPRDTSNDFYHSHKNEPPQIGCHAAYFAFIGLVFRSVYHQTNIKQCQIWHSLSRVI